MIDKVLLVNVPSDRSKGTDDLPLGLLYVGGALERIGIEVKIFDFYLYDFARKDGYGYNKLRKVLDDFRPDLIGLGGIATSYPLAKQFSRRIKRDYPKMLQIAGGALSSVYELLLTKTAVNVVFHGEAESNLPLFIERLNSGNSYHDISGISYLKGDDVRRNQPVPHIKNLDDIPLPHYHLLDVEKYLMPKERFLDNYKKCLVFEGLYDTIKRRLENVRYFLPVVTSRGCLYHCSFCYRQMQSYRKHSVDYVICHIRFLMEQFGINGFFFMDELFNGDKEWVMELCDAIERNNLKIAYKTGGARADMVSEEMLQRMYDTGCFNINYGQESGSNRILKEYRKGVSREKNIETTLLTRRCGMCSIVQLVIGSPGETSETIMETIDFLKEVRVNSFSTNYLIPLPGAPIWKYVEEKNLIKDVERYLERVALAPGYPIVNLTSVSNREWRTWRRLIQYKLDMYYAKDNKDILACARIALKYQLDKFLPRRVKKYLKSLLGYIRGMKYWLSRQWTAKVPDKNQGKALRKVTFLLSNNYFGGVARVVFEFAKELLNRGYKVTVIVPIVPYWQFHRLVTFRKFNRIKKIGIVLLYILKCFYSEWKRKQFKWIWQEGLNIEVKRYLLKPSDNLLLDADWLFLSNCWYQFYDISEKIAKNKRIIQIIHHYEEPDNKEVEKLILDAYKLDFLRITESRFTADQLTSKGVKVDEIVHFGIDKNYFYPRKSKPESMKILMYYDIEKRKGAHIGIESLESIRSVFNDIRICLFSPTPTKFAVNDYSLKFSLSDKELGELYRAHSIFVFPSLLEGFALPPLEAMACGCAVVTTRVGAVEEFAVNMESAIIVEPGDVDAIKKAIELLLRDNNLRARISHNAAVCASRFTWGKSVDKLEELLK